MSDNEKLQELVEQWKQKSSDAVEKFRHQSYGNRDSELWGLHVAYSNAAAQLEAVILAQTR